MEEEEVNLDRLALTPRGFYQLNRVMEYFKQGVDLEDIAEMLDLAGKEHIQLLMVIAEHTDSAEKAELYGHAVWDLGPDEGSMMFDFCADAQDSEARHREFHAAGSALSFFQNNPGVLPDEFTREWIECLYDEMIDSGISEIR